MQPSTPVSTRLNPQRRGLTTPLVAVALLVAMMGLALILDRLWLEAARLELTTAAEASALAGARQLASDRRLLLESDPEILADQAVQAAMMAAIENRVAGQPVIINEGDISFPQPAADDTSHSSSSERNQPAPESILVTAHRTRFRGNPVALFIGGLTGQPFGDAAGRAGAAILGNVVGVRPLPGSVVPAIPLAIWQADPTAQRVDTWQTAIEQRKGRDDFGFDEHSHTVTGGSDGIPELTLRSARRGGPVSEANVQLVDVGSKFQDEQILHQFQLGWSTTHLEDWGGELRLATASPISGSDSLTLEGLPELEADDLDALYGILGEPRIALLYSEATPKERSKIQSVDCVRLVAIRVLKVTSQSDGSCRITVQPTVLATRSALVEAPMPADAIDAPIPGTASQPTYIYRLQLTQ